MVLKATLPSPFSLEDKLNFIVKYNHELGYEIRTTETGLEAYGLSDEEKEDIVKNNELEKNQKEFNEKKNDILMRFLDSLIHEDEKLQDDLKYEMKKLDKEYEFLKEEQ